MVVFLYGGFCMVVVWHGSGDGGSLVVVIVW